MNFWELIHELRIRKYIELNETISGDRIKTKYIQVENKIKEYFDKENFSDKIIESHNGFIYIHYIDLIKKDLLNQLNGKEYCEMYARDYTFYHNTVQKINIKLKNEFLIEKSKLTIKYSVTNLNLKNKRIKEENKKTQEVINFINSLP